MEASPSSLDIKGMAADITKDFPEIQDVHHVHAWSLGSGQIALTAHVRIHPEIQDSRIFPLLEEIEHHLMYEWSITHTTLQPEINECNAKECIPLAQATIYRHGHKH